MEFNEPNYLNIKVLFVKIRIVLKRINRVKQTKFCRYTRTL